MIDETAIMEGSGRNSSSVPETLEPRVRRLEEAVAALQDTQLVEERVAERVYVRLKPQGGNALPDSTGMIIDAGRRILPAAVAALQGQVNPQTTAAPTTPPGTSVPANQNWWWVDVWIDLRSMVKMFYDPLYRYQMSWTARVLPAAFLVLALTAYFWIPYQLTTIGIDRVVMIPLCFIAFKILIREAKRYRDVVAAYQQLPRP